MRVIYISALSSVGMIDMIKSCINRDPGYAVQKFNRLIVRGLLSTNSDVDVMSAPPIDRRSEKKLFINKREIEDGILYKYIPFINLKGFKQLSIFLYSFFSVLKYGILKKKYSVVCDALAISSSMGAVMASKIIGMKCVGIMTDMPGLMVNQVGRQQSPVKRLMHATIAQINKMVLSGFSHYVFLTEPMNNVVNSHNRPYIIMEGLCDSKMGDMGMVPKFEVRTIMYAGGLHEKYGLKKLTEAFMSLPDANIRLLVYGAGPYADELKRLSELDSRIDFRGLASNNDVIAAEMQSTLLVNPRPTTEEFTKYSFPSKNIEYMASGTPLLTTKLPGIPAEYSDYVFFIEDESVEGYANALNRVLSKGDTYLADFGDKAKQWVLKHKNYKYQASRIISLLKI